MPGLVPGIHTLVIASEAIQFFFAAAGLLRRFAPRNDEGERE